MKRIFYIVLTVALCFTGLILSHNDTAAQNIDTGFGLPPAEDQNPSLRSIEKAKDKPKYAPGEVLVKLKEGAVPTLVLQKANLQYKQPERIHNIKSAVEKHKKALAKGADKMYQVKGKKYSSLNQIPDEEVFEEAYKQLPNEEKSLYRSYKIKLPPEISVEDAVEKLKQDPDIEYAEPNYLNELYMVPNDPYYSSTGSWGQAYDDLWGLKKIQCATAWDKAHGTGVTVAVIDTGLDYNHEDIASNVWTNTKEIANNGIDDDANGYTDDVRGWDFSGAVFDTIAEDKDPMDEDGHGTHVSGTIAAVGNNSKGVIGVAYKAKIMPLKGFPNSYDDVMAKAIRYAADNGAKVLSNSWGKEATVSTTVMDAFEYAYNKGCVLVVAAGNSSQDALWFEPARYHSAITVASSDHNDALSDFSNYGVKIDVTAPGGDNFVNTLIDPNRTYINILSLQANGLSPFGGYVVGSNYYRFRGTSMAAPHVSGLAALILSKNPAYKNEEVRQVIRKSANDLGTAGWDTTYGYGRINASQAMTIARPPIAHISSLKLDRTAKTLTVNGSASAASYFSNYKLFYGSGTNPTVWTTVKTSTAQVTNGALAVVGTVNLQEGQYIFKLTTSSSLSSGEDRTYFYYNPNFVLEWSYGTSPWDVAVDEINGFVYVNTGDSVKKFDTIGNFLKGWSLPGQCSIATDKDGYLWTLNHAMPNTDIVNKWDSEGNKLFSFGYHGDGHFLISRPDFDIDEYGNIYVLNYYATTSQIQKYDKNGNFLMNIGSFGPTVYEGSVAVDNDYLYVAETRNNRIQQFTTQGVFVRTIGSSGSGDGQFNYLKRIATDWGGKLYVVDADNARVQVFDSSGNFLYKFGSLGMNFFEGEMRGPWGIHVDRTTPHSHIYVTQFFNEIVQKFKQLPTIPAVIDDGNYTTSTSSLHAVFSSSDPESGIAEYQYKITVDSTTGAVIKNWTSTGTTASVTATGLTLTKGKTYYFSVKAKNGAGLWSAAGYSNGIKVDNTAPTTPVVTDSGAYTTSVTSLTASWTSSDAESGIAEYQYKITVDSTTGAVIKNWTSTGTTASVTATGLTLTKGKTYYFSVKAKNGAGLWSAAGYSDGIIVQ